MTTTPNAIDLDRLRTASFEKNERAAYRKGFAEPCILCGKAVADDNRYRVTLINGGDLATSNDIDTTDPGYCGAFPVGSDCARRARKAGVAVLEEIE